MSKSFRAPLSPPLVGVVAAAIKRLILGSPANNSRYAAIIIIIRRRKTSGHDGDCDNDGGRFDDVTSTIRVSFIFSLSAELACLLLAFRIGAPRWETARMRLVVCRHYRSSISYILFY